MNRLIIYIFLVFYSVNLHAQNSCADYYPLSTGNRWKYMHLSYEASPTPDTAYYFKEVVGDTVMPNGIKYFKIKSRSSIQFERFDTLTNEIKQYEQPWCDGYDIARYSLNYEPDSSIHWSMCNEVNYVVSQFTGLDDLSHILFESDYLVSEFTVLTERLGITNQTFTEGGKYESRLIGAVINDREWGVITDIDKTEYSPVDFKLLQNYPNPFNTSTVIEYAVNKTAYIKLILYDALGSKIKTLVDTKRVPGWYIFTFYSEELPSGVYYYSLTADSYNFSAAKKFVLLK